MRQDIYAFIRQRANSNQSFLIDDACLFPAFFVDRKADARDITKYITSTENPRTLLPKEDPIKNPFSRSYEKGDPLLSNSIAIMKVSSSAVLALTAAACSSTASAFVVRLPSSTRTTQRTTNSSSSSSVIKASVFGNPESPEPQISSAAFASSFGPGASMGGGAMERVAGARGEKMENVWDSRRPITVQGGALRTWSFSAPGVERVQILMKTEGRPLNANIELWHGPDNTPEKVAIYLEDGNLRPFNCVIETPQGHNAVAIYNTGHLEFPILASVEAELSDGSGASGLGAAVLSLSESSSSKTVQGGAIHTVPFSGAVESVALLLRTDGRPLNARVELLQGPNNNKQILEIYTEDGLLRPFHAILETPGVGNVVRVLNTASVEFPLTATIEPYLVTPGGEGLPSEYDRAWEDSANSFYFLGS